ncbi:MAG: Bbp16 family capsid cement protein [Rhodospirillales bacterium]
MILDSSLEYSNAQDLSQSTGTYVSTNVVDHGAANANPGLLLNAHVALWLPEAFTSGGSATMDLQFQTATDEAFTSPVVLYSTGAIGYATWNTNARTNGPFQFKLPNGILRFTRLAYVIAGATTTAGTGTAGIILTPQANRMYPDRSSLA